MQELTEPGQAEPSFSESPSLEEFEKVKDNILRVTSNFEREHTENNTPFNYKSFTFGNDKEIILVAGNSGAGKSALINYLMGCKMEPGNRKLNGSYELIVKDTPCAKIGYTTNSQTLFPEIFTKDNKYFYCDCAGFGDTRGPEATICTSVSTYASIQMAGNIKAILFVISYGSFDARADGLRKLVNHLYRFLSNIDHCDDGVDLKKSICLVITQLGPGVSQPAVVNELSGKITSIFKEKKRQYDRLEKGVSRNSKPEQLKELKKLGSFLRMVEFIQSKLPTLIVGDIFDEGATREHIQKFVATSPLIPKNRFNAVASEQRNNFDDFLTQLIKESMEVVERNNELTKKIETIQREIHADAIEYEKHSAILKALSASANAPNPEEAIRYYADLIKANEDEKARQQKDIDQLHDANTALNNEKSILDVNTPILYAGDKIHEKRHPLGYLGYTKVEVNYRGIPFKSAYATIYNGIGTYYLMKNGKRYDKQVLKSKKAGIYQFTYESPLGEDGILEWGVYATKKTVPANALRIEAITNEIKRNEESIIVLEQRVRDLDNRNKIYQGGMDSAATKQNAESECVRLKSSLELARKTCATYKAELDIARTLFLQKASTISLTHQLCKAMHNVLLDDSYANSFVRAYAELSKHQPTSADDGMAEEKKERHALIPHTRREQLELRAKLIAEKQSLLARLGEIDQQLETIDSLSFQQNPDDPLSNFQPPPLHSTKPATPASAHRRQLKEN